MTIFHDQTADKRVRRRLKTVFNADLDPADDLACDACHKGALILGTLRQGFNPSSDLAERTLVSKLLNEDTGFLSVAWLNHTDQGGRFR